MTAHCGISSGYTTETSSGNRNSCMIMEATRGARAWNQTLGDQSVANMNQTREQGVDAGVKEDEVGKIEKLNTLV